ncbi:ABC transporter ATP-binding protein [Micromonospora sp. 067-2]|uniref:ABC transporter ATP-binding protein n=1 Tax=Micromonospora sp. 067-2 TaxID=2789270 RepID=UPI003979A6ED
MTTAEPVLTVRDLTVEYRGARPVTAVRGVSLELGRGEIVGLAGESGCGKSTFAYGINQLLRPPALITGGSVIFHDRDGTEIDVLALRGRALRAYRWDKASIVFQGSMNSLNPVTRISAQLRDVLTTHRPDLPRNAVDQRCSELLELVGVDPTRRHSFPHELSGGMRQRVMIAMALALRPQLIIMDEPTTALDVLVQRDILAEIQRLQREFDFAVLFITHDLPLLLEISDRIAIMKEGLVVELDTVDRIYTAPQEAYTKTLLASFPTLTGERADAIAADGLAADGASR